MVKWKNAYVIIHMKKVGCNIVICETSKAS